VHESSAPSSGWSSRQGGPRFLPPQSESQWRPGQGGPSCRPPPRASNSDNWRPRWRSTFGQTFNQPLQEQQQSPQGQRQCSFGSSDQPPTGFTGPPRSFYSGCYVCGNFGCHSRYHTEDAVSPQAPPALPCQVCGQFGCHVTCHEGNVGARTSAVSTQTVNSASGPATNAVRPASNFRRSPPQGDRTPPISVSARPQTN